MIDLGRVSLETKGASGGAWFENTCEPAYAYYQPNHHCP